MNSRQEVAQAQLELETSTLELKSFIGLVGSPPVVVVLPSGIPTFTINEQVAVEEALANNPSMVSFERTIKEAKAEVAQSRAQNGFSAELRATYGLTDRGNNFAEVYNQPENEQTIRLEFAIPVLDWGRSKSRMKQAESLLRLRQYTIAQERVNFQQQVYTQARTFAMQRDQVKLPKWPTTLPTDAMTLRSSAI